MSLTVKLKKIGILKQAQQAKHRKLLLYGEIA